MSREEAMNRTRLQDMLKLQADIRMKLIAGGVGMEESHDLASEIFHLVIESQVIDEEYHKLYREMGES